MSRRLLQIFAAVNALVALYKGGAFVVLGIAAVPSIAGPEIPGIGESTQSLLDTWYRVLGWVWVSVGLMLAWITPAIETHTAWFRLIFVAFMCVGVGRLSAVAAHGFTSENTLGAIALEILVPSVCIVWQGFVARGAASGLAKA